MTAARIIHGDCRAILPTLPPASVHCVFTSPPYYACRVYDASDACQHALGNETLLDCLGWARGDKGSECYQECYVCRTREWAQQVWRVLRPDGIFWLNVGDGYDRQKNLMDVPGRLHLALAADGWICRSRTLWAKTNGMPESANDRPVNRHEDILMLVKTTDYWYDGDAIRKPYEITSEQRAERGDSGTAKYSAGVPGQERPHRMAETPRENIRTCGRAAAKLRARKTDEFGVIARHKIGKVERRSESVLAQRRADYWGKVAIVTPNSKQLTRQQTDAAAGTGIHAARKLHREMLRNTIDGGLDAAFASGALVSHPLGAARGSVWWGPTAQFRGRESEHYAVGPTWLAERCILAAAPEQCCAGCGKAYIRLSWALAAVRRRLNSSAGLYADELTAIQMKARNADGRMEKARESAPPAPKPFASAVPEQAKHLLKEMADTCGIDKNQEVYREDINPFAANAHQKFRPACRCNAKSAPGTVLDPFTGVGTTAVAAVQNGRQFIGAEMSEKYIAEAQLRLQSVPQHQPPLEI